jgi:hypothetical protein
VLANLAAELAGLSETVERIEDTLADGAPDGVRIGAANAPVTSLRHAGMRDLQELDRVRQVLADLARLVARVAEVTTQAGLDPTDLRDVLRLQSVADRLLARDPAQGPADTRPAEDMTFL